MEIEELDTALDELENRLERLRALYEQYFLGIEKLEPQIARKDVDRRIYILRREKIRNTGKRFKLQTLIQRYNTFQQYWQRVCREIENGTYRRHVARAEKNIGPTALLTVAARRRFGRERQREDAPPATEASAEQVALGASDTASEASAGLDTNLAARADVASVPEIERGGARPRTPTLPGIPAQGAPSDAGDLGKPVPVVVPAGTSGRPEPLAAASSSSKPPPARRSDAPKRPSDFESLSLDLGFLGDWDPITATRGRSAVGSSRASSEKSAAARTPTRVEAAPASPGAAGISGPSAGAESRPEAAAAGGAPRRLAPPPKPTRGAPRTESQPEAPPAAAEAAAHTAAPRTETKPDAATETGARTAARRAEAKPDTSTQPAARAPLRTEPQPEAPPTRNDPASRPTATANRAAGSPATEAPAREPVAKPAPTAASPTPSPAAAAPERAAASATANPTTPAADQPAGSAAPNPTPAETSHPRPSQARPEASRSPRRANPDPTRQAAGSKPQSTAAKEPAKSTRENTATASGQQPARAAEPNPSPKPAAAVPAAAAAAPTSALAAPPVPATPAAAPAPAPASAGKEKDANGSSPTSDPTHPGRPARGDRAKPAPTKPRPDPSLSDHRLRELHARWVEISKGSGQAPVSFDGLSKSVRAAEAKLRAQHGNRRIEFDIIVKDGRPVVKPTVR